MNKTDISEEKIIAVSIEILQKNQDADFSMRQVAKACGISVGSVYNYFPSKADLSVALIKTLWGRMFYVEQTGESNAPVLGYPAYVARLYEEVYRMQKEYHNFFLMHRTLFEVTGKSQGREAMELYLGHMKKRLLEVLNRDENVNERRWTSFFTREKLVEFTLQNIISALSQEATDCDFLEELLRRIVY